MAAYSIIYIARHFFSRVTSECRCYQFELIFILALIIQYDYNEVKLKSYWISEVSRLELVENIIVTISKYARQMLSAETILLYILLKSY